MRRVRVPQPAVAADDPTMTFNERAAKVVMEFIAKASPEEFVALARESSPDLFPPSKRSAPPKSRKLNVANKARADMPMTFSEKAAKTVREFLRTAKPGELVALARKGSPDLFPTKPKSRASSKSRKLNDHRRKVR